MSHAVLRSSVRFGAVSCLMAAPAAAQIKAIAVQGPTQLTAKQVAGGVELDWLAPAYPGATYKILRSDPANPVLAVVSVSPVTSTTYTDQLGTLILSQPKTYAYAVQAIWPNGLSASSGSVTITLQPAQRLGTLPVKCMTYFDLPAAQPYLTHVNGSYSGNFLEYLLFSYSPPSPYTAMTMTISNSTNGSLVPNGSFPLQLQTESYWSGYRYYWSVGQYPGSLDLSFDLTLSGQDAQCNVHNGTTHWSHTGSMP